MQQLPNEIIRYILKIKKFTHQKEKDQVFKKIRVAYDDIFFIIFSEGLLVSYLYKTSVWEFVTSYYYDEDGDLIEVFTDREIIKR